MDPSSVIPTPRSVEIAITGRCNLACQYCFYADEMQARRDLPVQIWLDFFARLGLLGVMDVTLTGGEVFTRQDIFQLIDGLIENRMRYKLLTNGTLITSKTIKQFETGKRRIRLDSIQVSIDGSSAIVHDQSRPNSFDRSIRGLRLLKQAGFPVTVRVTVNRHNVANLEEITVLLLEDIGVANFSTNEAFPCGAANREDAQIVLTPSLREQAMLALDDLAARYPGRINALAGPQVFARELHRIDQLQSQGCHEIAGRGRLSACNGVFSKIAVMHDGMVTPCLMLSSIQLGNIQKDDFGALWTGHPVLQSLRQRQAISLNSLDTCNDCRLIGFCTGGCPAGALVYYGQLNVRNPYDCIRVLKGEDPFVQLENPGVTHANR